MKRALSLRCAAGNHSPTRPRAKWPRGSRSTWCGCRSIHNSPPPRRHRRKARGLKPGLGRDRRAAIARVLLSVGRKDSLRRKLRSSGKPMRRLNRGCLTACCCLRMDCRSASLQGAIPIVGRSSVRRLRSSLRWPCPDLDWSICYQSRVGPLKWIGPATDARKSGGLARKAKALIVAPIAFVSEHSETLVELDIEFGKLARECGVRDYLRVPTVGTRPQFHRSALLIWWTGRSRSPVTPGDLRRETDLSNMICHMGCGFSSGDNRDAHLASAMPIYHVDPGVPHYRGSSPGWPGCSICRGSSVYHCETIPGTPEIRALQSDGAEASSARSSIRR